MTRLRTYLRRLLQRQRSGLAARHIADDYGYGKRAMMR
jgi:hypothetical protein